MTDKMRQGIIKSMTAAELVEEILKHIQHPWESYDQYEIVRDCLVELKGRAE